MASSPEENEILQKQAENLNRTIRNLCYTNNNGTIPQYVIIGRVKTKYSLERKEGIREVLDKYAYTVICKDEDDCNLVLQMLKQGFELVYTKEGKSTEKNYIKSPKPNGYKSIHIGLKSEDGTIIEVHIETPEIYIEIIILAKKQIMMQYIKSLVLILLSQELVKKMQKKFIIYFLMIQSIKQKKR